MKLATIALVGLFSVQSVAPENFSLYNWADRTPVLVGRGKLSMELLLVALAGLGGAALLLTPPSSLPSDTDYKKAKDKLATTPEDPDANTVVGKYLAFVLGDYDEAMPYLAKSGDKTLRTLAEHERAPLYTDTGVKKVGMGDEWVAAAKTFPALFRIFYDRGAYWYASAWTEMKSEPLWGDKLRERGLKLAASKPPGAGRKGLPSGWAQGGGIPGGKPPVLDGTMAHVGSYSAKVVPADEKVKDSGSVLQSDLIPISGKTLELSAYVFSDGTENAADQLRLNFFNANGGWMGAVGPYVPVDVPFWTRIYTKVQIPEGASRAQLGAVLYSKKGNMWVDDVSIKVDGKEVLKNGSFEEK